MLQYVPRHLRLVVAAAGVVGMTCAVRAEPDSKPGPKVVPSARSAVASPSTKPTLKPVDPGVADVDPLGTSTRILPKDLRQPANFDRVYEVELNGKRFFVRAHGGVYAVFPRSDYVQTNRGAVPIVPAGTVYHLGSLTRHDTKALTADEPPVHPAAAKPARPSRRDQAAPSTAAPSPESAAAQPAPSARRREVQRQATEPPLSDAAPPVPRAPEAASIWTSELLRVSRTGALLDQARAARAVDKPPAVAPTPPASGAGTAGV